MTRCAKCGRECAKDPRHGILQWCPKCPPTELHRFDPYTVGSSTGWAGGRAKTGRQDESDGFDLGLGYDRED